MKKILCSCFLLLVVILATPIYAQDTLQVEGKIQQEELSLSSAYAYVWNVEEGIALYEKAAHERMYPASMTKIMTTLVALDELDDLDAVYTFTEDIFDGLAEEGASVAGYQVGDQATIKDLLYGIMLPSGADAARAIASLVAGSETAYAQKMNEKAQALGMNDTHFVNTSGLHDDDHYSTVYDVSLMLQAALKYEPFKEIFGAVNYHTSYADLTFSSTRLTSLAYAGISENFLTGSKTGFTLEGGLCLAASMEVNGAHYLTITGLASTDPTSGEHMADAKRIQTYLSDHYELANVFAKQTPMTKLAIRHGKQEEVDGMLQEDAQILMEKGEQPVSSFQPEENVAPIEQGAVIATLTITSPSLSLTHTYDVFATQAINRDWLSYLLHAWWFYVLCLLFLFLMLLFVIKQKKKKMRRNSRNKRK